MKKLPLGRINEFLKTFTPNLGTNGPAHPVHPPTNGGTTVYPLPDVQETLSVGTIRCPFCPAIERKTPWYLHDKIHDIVVCQDLNNRQFKLKILVVGSGTRWHEPWDSLPKVHQDLFIALAEAFAAYAITKGHAKILDYIDIIHCLHPGHAHIQACLI